ncbi:MAG TPA: hypothetical protein VHO70_06995, partial [Chitinispirillaceae bacterium]|nr:hypothetical protein [Chitinispirillaceae bacterium]
MKIQFGSCRPAGKFTQKFLEAAAQRASSLKSFWKLPPSGQVHSKVFGSCRPAGKFTQKFLEA